MYMYILMSTFLLYFSSFLLLFPCQFSYPFFHSFAQIILASHLLHSHHAQELGVGMCPGGSCPSAAPGLGGGDIHF